MKNQQGGFLTFFLIIIVAVLGAMYFIKDENGVNYIQKTINIVTERKEAALDKATGARDLQSEHNQEIDAMINDI
jgi:hypothetical protein